MPFKKYCHFSKKCTFLNGQYKATLAVLHYMQEVLDSEAREYCIALIFIAVEENKEKI